MKISLVNRFLTIIISLSVTILSGAAYRIIAAGGLNGTVTSTSNNLRQPIANSNGLVAWYPLDGDAKDYGSNHNDGTLTNFTYDGTTNGWTGGKFGKGLLFNGSSDYISVLPLGTLPTTTSPMSISTWFKTTLSNGNGSLVAWGPGSGYFSSLGFYNHQIGFDGHGIGLYTSENSYIDGSWHLATISYDGSSMTLYMDGNNVASGLISVGTPSASQLYIAKNLASSAIINGAVDDVRIFNRALSASEVSSLYAGSPPQNCDQTCKVWLKFDDNTGTIAKDSVGTYPGSLNGGTTWATGNFASAVFLNGSTGYVSVSDLGLTAGTMDMWINPVSVSGDQRLLTQASGAATQAGQIAINQLSGESGSLWVWDGSAWQRLSPDGTVKAGQWNQVVVANIGGTVTAYINGTQQRTAAAAFNFSGVAANIGGNFLSTTGGTFNGSVDDFRVYTRMLAPEEVADQWRQGT